jgi:ABC-type nitrate/sulfonate/bicarbonate transport system substrate-binding protein
MKQRQWNGLSRAALIGATLAVALASMASGAFAADKIHVGKAQGPAWTFLPANIGVEEGIFAKYGLDVEVLDLSGDAKVQQALLANSIEFGLGSGPGMAFAAKGSPVIAVAAFAAEPRNISAIALADTPIKAIADLKGKLISVSTAGSLTEWLTKQMSLQEGWGPEGVRIVALGAIDAALAALKAHQVDAVVLSTEAGFLLEERKEGRIIVGMDKYAPRFITHVVFAQKQLLQSNPALIERFLKGFFASIAFMKANKPKVSALAERLLHHSPTVASRSYDYEISMLLDDGHFDPQAVEILKQSFVDMGTLDRKPGNEELFTTKFLPVKP